MSEFNAENTVEGQTDSSVTASVTSSEKTAPTESRLNRLRVGDKVEYVDESEWPPTKLEGEIKGFANDEATYLDIDFGGESKVLTEEEVKRVS